MKGTVQALSAKDFNGTMLYSAKISDSWVGFGNDKPPFSKGDFVELNTQMNARNRLVAVPGSVRVLQNEVIEARNTAPKSSASDREAYWSKREERDILTQKTIQLQSSRNSAIALADIILKNGALASYEKAAANKKMDLVLALVDELTDRFQAMSKAAGSAEIATEKEDDAAPTEGADIWNS